MKILKIENGLGYFRKTRDNEEMQTIDAIDKDGLYFLLTEFLCSGLID